MAVGGNAQKVTKADEARLESVPMPLKRYEVAHAKGSFGYEEMPNERSRTFMQTKRGPNRTLEVSGLPLSVCKELYEYLDYIWSLDNVQDCNVYQGLMRPLQGAIGLVRAKGLQTLGGLTEEDLVATGAAAPWRMRNVFKKLAFTLERSKAPELLARDDWDIGEFDINPQRINKSARTRQLHFSGIEDASNRRLAKVYIKHLLEDTDTSVSTIKAALGALKIALSLLDCRLSEIDREAYERLLVELHCRYPKPAVFNVSLIRINAAVRYLTEVGEIEGEVLFKEDRILGAPYDFKETSVRGYVTDQILDALPAFSERSRMYFLLIYVTGMRASEATQIKRDAAYEIEGRYYLRYSSEKMHDKPCTNEIGPRFFELFRLYSSNVPASQGNWLFPNPSGKECLLTYSLNNRLKKEIERAGVINEDGTPYRFRPHDWRHTFATDLLDSGATFYQTQSLLHHNSARMTTAYIETLPKRLAEKNRFKLERVSGAGHDTDSDLMLEGEWLRQNINAQLLPNGVCAKPRALGPCPHGFTCLTCPDFVPDESFLGEYKKHAGRLESHAARCRALGLAPEERTSLKQAAALRSIIEELIDGQQFQHGAVL